MIGRTKIQNVRNPKEKNSFLWHVPKIDNTMHILVHFMIFIYLSFYLSIYPWFFCTETRQSAGPCGPCGRGRAGRPGRARRGQRQHVLQRCGFLASLDVPIFGPALRPKIRKVGVFDPYKWDDDDDDDDDVYMILSNDHLISWYLFLLIVFFCSQVIVFSSLVHLFFRYLGLSRMVYCFTYISVSFLLCPL